MKAPIENRPESVTEAEADRILAKLIEGMKGDAQEINFGGLTEVAATRAEWKTKNGLWNEDQLDVTASIYIYDETGTLRILTGIGLAEIPQTPEGKWFLRWRVEKAGSCLAC
jgi:hypothetical protein